ncbi:acetyltransferase (GNAT) family protein [Stackebrandtia albiflava]|uniref:Acetyltransferase (GNAT) family protein n=1 Tax=Stackebrandtia albiflava TaxID=406432 RepID=A0A562ULN1_9ACTN|nr:GNAT family N-acetyltransferase [Stackebrandtia albiflava]TWJ06517.1 acetyltransferase (GNAT) family protein [Stackebrandtia albiflava]
MIHIQAPERLDTADTARWHRILAAASATDTPAAPVPTAERLHHRLTGTSLDSRRVYRLAVDESGELVGAAGLRLFDSEGQAHLAELELVVDPAHRRHGTGSRLLEEITAAARADGRRSVITEVADGGPAEAFHRRHGFDRMLTLHMLSLDLAETRDDDRFDAEGDDHAGYDLVRWRGVAPAQWRAGFVTAKNAMNDMPVGDMDYGTVGWDVDRIVRMAEVIAARGDVLLTVAAVKGDSVAGYTEVVVSPEGTVAQQYDTVVVPEHRGHGLGFRMKAHMVRDLASEFPGVTRLVTDNAEQNRHMRAVNDRLGFRLDRIVHEYQLTWLPGAASRGLGEFDRDALTGQGERVPVEGVLGRGLQESDEPRVHGHGRLLAGHLGTEQLGHGQASTVRFHGPAHVVAVGDRADGPVVERDGELGPREQALGLGVAGDPLRDETAAPQGFAVGDGVGGAVFGGTVGLGRRGGAARQRRGQRHGGHHAPDSPHAGMTRHGP